MVKRCGRARTNLPCAPGLPAAPDQGHCEPMAGKPAVFSGRCCRKATSRASYACGDSFAMSAPSGACAAAKRQAASARWAGGPPALPDAAAACRSARSEAWSTRACGSAGSSNGTRRAREPRAAAAATRVVPVAGARVQAAAEGPERSHAHLAPPAHAAAPSARRAHARSVVCQVGGGAMRSDAPRRTDGSRYVDGPTFRGLRPGAGRRTPERRGHVTPRHAMPRHALPAQQ